MVVQNKGTMGSNKEINCPDYQSVKVRNNGCVMMSYESNKNTGYLL